jgi:hypothetical protein
MTGYIDSPVSGAVGVGAQGTEAIPSSTGEVLGAAAAGGFAHAFPIFEAGRATAEMGIDPSSGMPLAEGTFGRTLSADEANASYGIKGRLAWTAPVPEGVAQEQLARKREDIAREDFVARRESGLLTGGAARFVAGLAGGLPGLADPTNIAASFLPVVPEARAALWAARGGVAGRIATGAIEGAAGQAALTPIQMGLAAHDQEDFGATDALLNIALGGVFGGGLHAALGRAPAPETERLATTIDRARPELREDLLRGSVADMAEGRPVEAPAEIFDRSGYIAETGGRARPYDAVPQEPLRLAEFLRQQGGVRNEGDEINTTLDGSRTRPGLINNRTGMSLDRATYAAWEAGYLPDHPEDIGNGQPDTNALLDALDRDVRGTPVYSEQDAFLAAQHRAALDRNAEIDRLSAEHEIPVSGKTQDQFYAALSDKLGRENASAEAERLAASSDQIMQRAAAEGWVPDFGEGSPRTPEEIEHAYRQETAARRADAGEGGLGQPEPVGRAARGDQTGAGPGGRGLGDRRRVEPQPEPELPRELSAEDARPPLDRVNEHIAELERELARGEPEGAARPAELDAADRQVADAEGRARAIEHGGTCLGRRL